MFLSKRNQTYYLWYTDSNGKRYKRSTRTRHRTDALRFLDDFAPRKSAPVLFSQYLKDYFVYSESCLAFSTTKNYKTAANSFIKFVGNLRLDEYTPRTLDHYLSVIRNSASIATSRTYHAALSSVFETARRWGYISENPWREVKRPNPGDRAPVFFTINEFKDFLSVIDKELFRDLVVVAFFTGMRASELRGLTWNNEHIDVKRRLIMVPNTEARQTKNKRSRIIPMHDEVARILKKRKRTAQSKFVFATRCGQLRYWYPSRSFRQYARQAKLPEAYSFHTLRHSFATNLLSTANKRRQDTAVSLYTVGLLLGHTDYSTTSRIYVHLDTRDLHEVVNNLPKLM